MLFLGKKHKNNILTPTIKFTNNVTYSEKQENRCDYTLHKKNSMM